VSQPRFAPAYGGQSSGRNYAIQGSSRVRRGGLIEPARPTGAMGGLSRVDLDPKRLLTLAAIAPHGGIAAAARVLGTTPSAVIVIFESRYRIVVPESWPTPSTPAELDGRAWVGAPPQTARGRAFARFAAEHGITPSAPCPHHQSAGSE